MPASRLASRDIKPKRVPRWPLILLSLVALSAAIVFALPASMIAYFLPAQVHAEDFSGSLMHGAAGKITVNSRDAGAIEWRLHPLALLHLAIAADIHWVKVGFVIDGAAQLERHRFAAHGIQGGGPIDSLRDLGVAAGWRGNGSLNFSEISGDFSQLLSAVGKIEVTNLVSADIASGSELGGYVLELRNDAVSPDGSISAQLSDTGGPMQIQAQIRLSPAARTGTLSGTLKARPDASAALRNQLDSMAQLRPRDSQGRFPVELEFNF
jgi:Type II secretion system (T2SS), protein N